MNKKVMVSGGFDPIHVGHIRMIQEASKYGDVIVALNSDSWLIRKKGYFFMEWEERAEIIKAIEGVSLVVQVGEHHDHVCDALEMIRPDYFANGGDRTEKNTPEKEVCSTLGIEMLWGIGGDYKANSSSIMVMNALDKIKRHS